jgi:hypothetical protein
VQRYKRKAVFCAGIARDLRITSSTLRLPIQTCDGQEQEPEGLPTPEATPEPGFRVSEIQLVAEDVSYNLRLPRLLSPRRLGVGHT